MTSWRFIEATNTKSIKSQETIQRITPLMYYMAAMLDLKMMPIHANENYSFGAKAKQNYQLAGLLRVFLVAVLGLTTGTN